MFASAISLAGLSEPVNAISHFAGAAVVFVLGCRLLKRSRGDTWRVLCMGTFVFACVFQLSVSGIYHVLDPAGTPRLVLRRLDHAAIFVLIAGTFTPIHGILFSGQWRWAVLVFMWSAAVSGITLQSIFLDRMPPWLSVIFYLALGWIGLLSAWKLYQRYGWPFIACLVYGGVAYSLGAAFLGLGALTGALVIIPGVIGRHEVFHFAVLAGIGLHWKFITSFASETPSDT